MTSTIIWLRVAHDITGVRPRERTASRQRFFEEHPFEVRVVGGNETKLVAEMRRPNPALVRGRLQTFAWREHEGRLYRSLLDAEGGPVAIGGDAKPVYGKPSLESAYYGDHADYPFGGGRERNSIRGYNSALIYTSRQTCGFRTPYNHDDLPRALAVAQARAEQLLLIDGHLHIEAPPPGWVLYNEDMGRGDIEDASCVAFIPDYDDWSQALWVATDPGHLQWLLDALQPGRPVDMVRRHGEELVFHVDPPAFDPTPILAASIVDQCMRYFSGAQYGQVDAISGAAMGAMRLAASNAPIGWSDQDRASFDAAVSAVLSMPEVQPAGLFELHHDGFSERRDALKALASLYRRVIDLVSRLDHDDEASLERIAAL